jgi:hypothetical protein
MAERNKRDLPDWLFQILEWDKKITKTAFECFDGHFGYKKYRSHMKALELSGHGLIWLVVCFAMLYFGFDPSLWMNMLMLQVLDIILIAITKAIARRRRPALSEDDMFVSFLMHIASDALNFVVNTVLCYYCLLRNLMHQTLLRTLVRILELRVL